MGLVDIGSPVSGSDPAASAEKQKGRSKERPGYRFEGSVQFDLTPLDTHTHTHRTAEPALAEVKTG
jgi:hypothetical protein